MTGHRPFSELTKGFTPERRTRVAAKAAQLREAMTLEELRKARDLSQEEVAVSLAVGQQIAGGSAHVVEVLYLRAVGLVMDGAAQR